jgi:hypothetical protein
MPLAPVAGAAVRCSSSIAIQDASSFADAFLGLTPKQTSSGGKQKLGRRELERRAWLDRAQRS